MDQVATPRPLPLPAATAQNAGSFNMNGYSETIGAIQSQGPGDGVIEAAGSVGGPGFTLTIGTTRTSTTLGYTGTGTYSFSGWIRDGNVGPSEPYQGRRLHANPCQPQHLHRGHDPQRRLLRAVYLANGGGASSIGASTNNAANLVFNGGDLQYTGGRPAPTASSRSAPAAARSMPPAQAG